MEKISMDDNLKELLVQKKAQLKVKQQKAEIQQYKKHFVERYLSFMTATALFSAAERKRNRAANMTIRHWTSYTGQGRPAT